MFCFSPILSMQSDVLVNDLEEVIEELGGMVLFVEETWVQEGVHGVTHQWTAANLARVMHEVRA